MIKSLFFIATTLSFGSVFSQTNIKQDKTYEVKLHNISSINLNSTTEFLKRVSAATDVSFTSDSLFIVQTYKELDPRIIEGKMQKNFTPVKEFKKIK